MSYRDDIGAQTFDLLKCLYSANNHAEYMAKSAENLIDAINRREIVLDDDRINDERILDQVDQELFESVRTLRSRIYEFRKRSQIYSDGKPVGVMDAAKIVKASITGIAAAQFQDGMTADDDRRFLEIQEAEMRRAAFQEEMRLDAFGPKHG